MSATVAVVRTSPETYFEDVKRAVKIAGGNCLVNGNRTAIKLNLSWSKFFPACSTAPYAFDAAIMALLDAGHQKGKIFSLENETVVTNIHKGLDNNKWNPVLQKYNIPFIPLNIAEWVPIKLERPTLVLEKMFPPVQVPKALIGANVLHLPTVKTHGHSFMTGAKKNAFGLLLRKTRHQAHLVIHEILVDLLMVQKQVCKELFAITDGSVIGDGPGPRTMIPVEGNIILASKDMVAQDTVQSKILNIDPFKVKKLVLAQRGRLGIMDPDKIHLVGDFDWDDFPLVKTHSAQSPVIAGNRLVLKNRGLRHLMHNKYFMIGPIMASSLYHDAFWYPLIGKARTKDFLNRSAWGKLFNNY